LTDPKADNAGRDRAHREIDASLTDWIVAGLRRLKPRGTLVLIHRTERLATLLAGLEGPAGAIEIVPLVSRQGRPASRVLVRARKGSRKSLRLFSALTVHRGSTHISHQTDYTDEATKILREMRELLPDARLGGRED
jgi:tRNA1(Val) A37 N6-methylase TrmN6